MEKLTGLVENITFQAEQGGFVVFRLKLPGEGGTVPVVGNVSAPFIGDQLDMDGEWVEHARFGRQFRVASYRRVAPTTTAGIERFLASGAVKGIGPSMAARLVEHFGAQTLEVLDVYPHRLVEVSGIGTKKAEMIRQSYAELAEMREVLLYLELHGVTGAYAAKIFAHYGSASVDVLKENPYQLAADVDGIGFRTADQIAMSLGMPVDCGERLAAGIQYALLQISLNGHTCVPEELLVQETAKLLRVERLVVAEVLQRLIREDQLYTEDYHGMVLIYPRYLYYAEKRAAERLLQLQQRARPTAQGDHEATVAEWEAHSGIQLAAAQHEALVSALRHGVLVLTGGPGTGKTTVVKGILGVLQEQRFVIKLAAPTGRAAKRLSEASGCEAVTVHRLLESTGGVEGAPLFLRTAENPLEADVVIIDEASMLDISLTSYLLQAVPDGCRVIFVGDVDQLPAVGPGSVLKDIIRSEVTPVVRLTEVFRQSGESPIILNAHRINRGLLPDISSSLDFQFLPLADSEAVARKIVELCSDELPATGYGGWGDVQVLSPMHRQDCGVENLNRMLQAAMNPPAEYEESVNGINQEFRPGDKVMQIRNNYEKNVFNGDIGLIARIESGRVTVRYPDQDVVYERRDIDQLRLAYAMSVHKSQGSEYPVVVMPLVPGHRMMLQRNLLYTAVTRAKERVILLGTKAALQTALDNDRTRRRYSLLAERLRGEGLLC
ncbi:MAG: helicase, RecD/TraA family [Firmicutes bacterium]|nr:helicase, RecD/TraA family [Bacillota bacterium]